MLPTNDKVEVNTSIATGEGTRTQVDENLESKLQGTGGLISYPLRVALAPVKVTSADAVGTVKMTVPLSDFLDDPQVTALKQRFMFWKLSDVAMNIQSISPWSTASGSIQVFYNKDPENSVTGQTGIAPITMALRLLRSQQASAKMKDNFTLDNSELSLAPLATEWKFCKKSTTSYPRLERYGDIVIAVRAACATGDGVEYTVTLAANIMFKDATYNSPFSAYKIPFKTNNTIETELDQVNGSINLLVKLDPIEFNGDVFDASGEYRLAEMVEAKVVVEDAQDPNLPVEHYNLRFSQGAFDANADNLTLVVPTLIASTNQHHTPQISNIVMPEFSGWLAYLAKVDEDTFSGFSMSNIAIGLAKQPQHLRRVSKYMTECVERSPSKPVPGRVIYQDCDTISSFQ